MGYANHIGRISALAVALGVGAAVGTTPGVAWAEETSAASDSSTTAPDSTTPATDAGPAADPSPAAEAGDSAGDDSTSTDTSTSTDAEGSGTTIVGGDRPQVTISVQTTGDDTTEPEDDADAVEEEAPDSMPSDSGTAPAVPAAQRNGGSTAKPAAPSSDAAAAAPLRVLTRDADSDVADADPVEDADAITTLEVVSQPSATRQSAALGSLDAVTPISPPEPLNTLLAAPTTVIAQAVNLVVSLFEPLIGPNAPLYNALLWGALDFVRRQTFQTLSNRTPEIGTDSIELVVEADSVDNPISGLPANDADGDVLTYSVDPNNGPSNGQVGVTNASTVTYTPDPGFFGTETFTLIASDAESGFFIKGLGQGSTDTVTVTITVENPNRPVATPDGATVDEGDDVVINVLDNDTDPNEDDLDPTSVEINTQPLHGTVVVNSDGTVTYENDGSEATTDSFAYTVTDETGAVSKPGLVTVTINPVDDPPVAVNDSASTAHETLVVIDVLANDTDVDGGPKQVTGVTEVSSGATVDIRADGKLEYTPADGFSGVDTFKYTLNGGSTATVTVTVAEPVEGGNAVAFGFAGSSGQLDIPELPPGVFIVDVDAGTNHTVYLLSDGTAVAAGSNIDNKATVPPLPANTVYTQIAAGAGHTLYLRSDGKVIGTGDFVDGRSDFPDPPDGLMYTQIAAGDNHSVALLSDGTIVGAGFNGEGQIDFDDLPEGMTYIGIAAGRGITLLLQADGQVVRLGNNESGQGEVPPLPPGVKYTKVVAGDFRNTGYLRDDGHAVVIGNSAYGFTGEYAPPVGTTYVDLAIGENHILLLRSDGVVETYGENSHGQMDIPPLEEGQKFTDIATGIRYSVLVVSDGTEGT